MPLRNLLPLAAAICLLTACETNTTVDYRTLAGKNRAAIAAMVQAGEVELKDVQVESFAAAESGVDFQTGDSVMRIEGSRSFVHLFILPETATGQRLVIRSYPTFNRPVSLFVPNITFIDRGMSVLEFHSDLDYRPVASMRGDHLLGEVRVPAGAMYVLVSTDDAKVGTRFEFKSRALIGQDPDERDMRAGFAASEEGIGGSYEGRVRLTLE